jgi:hypothetical protein
MQEMHDFEQWMRRAGFPRQRHQCLEQRAHRAYPLDQSITHESYRHFWHVNQGMFGLKGNPVSIKIPRPAQNTEAARKLWEISEQLTGAVWPAGQLNRAAFLTG